MFPFAGLAGFGFRIRLQVLMLQVLGGNISIISVVQAAFCVRVPAGL